MNYEIGQVLDDARPVGNHVHATLVVDPDAVSPQTKGSYSTHNGVVCPICQDEVSMVVWAYCIRHDMTCRCWHCPDCWLTFEVIQIGTLDEEGNYHEL